MRSLSSRFWLTTLRRVMPEMAGYQSELAFPRYPDNHRVVGHEVWTFHGAGLLDYLYQW